jgi:hypothetical protein
VRAKGLPSESRQVAALAGVDHGAAQLHHALQRGWQVVDREVRQRGRVTRAGSALVDAKAEIRILGHPALAVLAGPGSELSAEHAASEPQRALGIVGGELDQGRGHQSPAR